MSFKLKTIKEEQKLDLFKPTRTILVTFAATKYDGVFAVNFKLKKVEQA